MVQGIEKKSSVSISGSKKEFSKGRLYLLSMVLHSLDGDIFGNDQEVKERKRLLRELPFYRTSSSDLLKCDIITKPVFKKEKQDVLYKRFLQRLLWCDYKNKCARQIPYPIVQYSPLAFSQLSDKEFSTIFINNEKDKILPKPNFVNRGTQVQAKSFKQIPICRKNIVPPKLVNKGTSTILNLITKGEDLTQKIESITLKDISSKLVSDLVQNSSLVNALVDKKLKTKVLKSDDEKVQKVSKSTVSNLSICPLKYYNCGLHKTEVANQTDLFDPKEDRCKVFGKILSSELTPCIIQNKEQSPSQKYYTSALNLFQSSLARTIKYPYADISLSHLTPMVSIMKDKTVNTDCTLTMTPKEIYNLRQRSASSYNTALVLPPPPPSFVFIPSTIKRVLPPTFEKQATMKIEPELSPITTFDKQTQSATALTPVMSSIGPLTLVQTLFKDFYFNSKMSKNITPKTTPTTVLEKVNHTPLNAVDCLPLAVNPLSKLGGGGKGCIICRKVAYPAERINTLNGIVHLNCFRCTKCNNLLNCGRWNTHESKYYCDPCHRRITQVIFRN